MYDKIRQDVVNSEAMRAIFLQLNQGYTDFIKQIPQSYLDVIDQRIKDFGTIDRPEQVHSYNQLVHQREILVELLQTINELATLTPDSKENEQNG